MNENISTSIVFCSLTLDDTRASRVAMYNATNGTDSISLKEMKDKVIEVKDVVIFKKMIKDDEQTLVSLITPEGTVIVTNSGTVMKTLQDVFQALGEPTWDEPVKFEVISGTSKNERTFYDLVLLG